MSQITIQPYEFVKRADVTNRAFVETMLQNNIVILHVYPKRDKLPISLTEEELLLEKTLKQHYDGSLVSFASQYATINTVSLDDVELIITPDGTPEQLSENKRHRIDNLTSVGGWTRLVCPICKQFFNGWKDNDKCLSCGVPVFPKGIRHVVSVAAKSNDNKIVYSLPAPYRHAHVIHEIYTLFKKPSIGVQGFLDNEGVYLSREEALVVALKANQIPYPTSIHTDQLFSEDIWP